MGQELAPTTGKKHWQGYVQLLAGKQMTLAAVKTKMAPAHVELCRGSSDQNIVYCKKDGLWVEWGEPGHQGQRRDLDDVAEEIKSGTKTVQQILLESPSTYHQYGRTLLALETACSAQRARSFTGSSPMPEIHWLWGEKGTGKSHHAHAEITRLCEVKGWDPDVDVLDQPDDHDWWDRHCGQRVLLLEEFRGEIKYPELLRICDKWPFSLRRRNLAPYPCRFEYIFITSCHHPNDVYIGLSHGDSIDQLLRRIRDGGGGIHHFAALAIRDGESN